MPTPSLIVRTMRRADVTTVVDLLVTTATTLGIGEHTTARNDRRRLILDIVGQAARTGNVDIAVRTTGSKVAIATGRTLLGVAVVTAHPSEFSEPQTPTGIDSPLQIVERVQQLSGRQRDHELRQATYYTLQYLAARNNASRNEVIAALLHVVHARLDHHGVGCYVHVHDDESRECLRHQEYVDIGEPMQHLQDTSIKQDSVGRHLWRHPAAAAAAAPASQSSNTGVSARSQRPRGTWTTAAVRQEVHRLHDDGWTATKIAAYLGCGRTTVTEIIRRRRRTDASLTPEMLRSYQQGHDTIHSIASRIGCPADTARRLLAAAGATMTDDNIDDFIADITDRYTHRRQSIKQIASETGRSYHFVRQQLMANVELRQHGGSRTNRTAP